MEVVNVTVHDWTPIKLLESTANLKAALKSVVGRAPPTSVAREIGVCLQQGRLFYESAEQAGLEIKPLLLFYGTMAFARALVVGRTLHALGTLPQSHGISDASPATARLTDLAVRIHSVGTFQRFNDVVANLNRLKYVDGGSMTQTFVLPTARAGEMVDRQFTVKDILSRIPGLEGLYRRTFHEPANVETISSLNPRFNDSRYWELRIDDHELFHDRAGLKGLVRKWRDRFPVLERWRVVEAIHAWDNSVIMFGNVAVPPAELDEECLSQRGSTFAAADDPPQNPGITRLPFQELINSAGGGLAEGRHFISPLKQIYISKYSLHYLGMFMLSSLVRYRPQTWIHAISRSVTADKASDDQALTLLEEFMRIHTTEIPAMIAHAFDPRAR